ncbi:class I SAM-dependent methyltransferase [Candidatus Woesearchaeota archaeon]|nr:class I SAM-dependent methyltransferase [Candidatus Woesearchaeota archaeon]
MPSCPRKDNQTTTLEAVLKKAIKKMKEPKKERGKTSHYYSEKQDSPVRLNRISAEFFGHAIDLWTSSGVFSTAGIDKGTEILLKNCRIKDSWDILDLGCGYGAVGIAIAKAYPCARIVMTDINKRAVKVARMNIKLNALKNARVVQGDCFESIGPKPAESFDTILLNPPQSAGKELCLRMISESITHIKPGGLLQIVARHNKGGKTLGQEMEKLFGNIEILAKKSGYWVYSSRKG